MELKWLLLRSYRQVEMKPRQPTGVQDYSVGLRVEFFFGKFRNIPHCPANVCF